MIEVFTEHVPRKHSPLSLLFVYRLDGAYCQVGDDETAFSGGRSPRYGVFIVGLAPTPGCWTPTAAGSAACGTRCARTPSAAETATSTA